MEQKKLEDSPLGERDSHREVTFSRPTGSSEDGGQLGVTDLLIKVTGFSSRINGGRVGEGDEESEEGLVCVYEGEEAPAASSRQVCGNRPLGLLRA